MAACTTMQKGSSTVGACICEDCPIIECNAGQYLYHFGDGEFRCAECPADSYQEANTHKNTECQKCSVHTTTDGNAGSTSESDCVCKSGYTLVDGTCEACEAGYFKVSAGNQACGACRKGFTTAGKTGSTSEDACRCPPGSEETETGDGCVCSAGFGETEEGCEACEKGKYKADAGDDVCEDCAVDQFQDETGGTECKSCPESTSTEGRKGTKAVGGCICEVCPECSAGQYLYHFGDGEFRCAECPADSYQEANTHKNTECQKCSVHTTTDGNAGSTSESDCVCKSGYTLVDGTCEACEAGYFKVSAGNQACGACRKGFTTAGKTGSTSEDACRCPPGSEETETGDGCVCSAGFGETEEGCEACEKGKYKADAGDDVCEDCAVDQFQDETGGTECKPCPEFTSTEGKGTKIVTGCVCKDCNEKPKCRGVGFEQTEEGECVCKAGYEPMGGEIFAARVQTLKTCDCSKPNAKPKVCDAEVIETDLKKGLPGGGARGLKGADWGAWDPVTGVPRIGCPDTVTHAHCKPFLSLHSSSPHARALICVWQMFF